MYDICLETATDVYTKKMKKGVDKRDMMCYNGLADETGGIHSHLHFSVTIFGWSCTYKTAYDFSRHDCQHTGNDVQTVRPGKRSRTTFDSSENNA